MNTKYSIRTFAILILIGLFSIGLTSCRLSASKGPISTTPTSEGLPVPGETQSNINVSVFATQTAQAFSPVPITTSTSPQNPGSTSTNPGATSVPESPAATETSIIYVTATPGGPPVSYTLEAGEFPFCIARRFDVNLAELLELNGLSMSSYSYAGEVLQLPQTGDPFVGTRALHDHPTYYKIQVGDTLNTIACYFGDVSPDMITLQNHLTSNNYSPGDTLIIP